MFITQTVRKHIGIKLYFCKQIFTIFILNLKSRKLFNVWKKSARDFEYISGVIYSCAKQSGEKAMRTANLSHFIIEFFVIISSYIQDYLLSVLHLDFLLKCSKNAFFYSRIWLGSYTSIDLYVGVVYAHACAQSFAWACEACQVKN